MIASATAGRSKNRAPSRAWFARATTAHIGAFIEKWRKRGVALPERNIPRGSDRPRAKALGRNWRRPFGAFPCCVYKKESGFGLLVSRRSRQRNSRCRRNRNKKVTKTRPDVTDRKASPDAPDFFLIFFGRVDPNTTRSHRQTPPIAIARSFQHAEKWPFRRRGGSAPPFSSGSVFARSRSTCLLAGLGPSCDLRPNRATSIFS